MVPAMAAEMVQRMAPRREPWRAARKAIMWEGH
jgi:hypothetical protein